jgi:DNA-binding PadR family transcriptional regulator
VTRVDQPSKTVRRVPRAERRVLLVLLSGAANLSGYPLARAARVSSGRVYVVLDRLENLGWVTGEWESPDPLPDGRPRRRFYRLTGKGRSEAMAVLGLTEQRER